MGKIAIKKENKRKDLLGAAYTLFTTKGFQNTSIADIVGMAGMAKGTFYLYFKDKEDIRDQLITAHATILFQKAYQELLLTELTRLDDKIIFVTDYILEQLEQEPALLAFLAKQLSWGIFRHSLSAHTPESELSGIDICEKIMGDDFHSFRNPEIIFYLIIELVAGTSYNAILYKEPTDIDTLKPYLHTLIRQILDNFRQ